MATGTVIFRPSEDRSLGHECSSGSSGFSLINEIEADNDSTYIQQSITSRNSANVTSEFVFSQESSIPNNAVLTSARLHIIASDTNGNATTNLVGTLTIGGTAQEAVNADTTTSYTDHNGSVTLAQMPYNSAVRATISTTGNKSNTKDSTSYIRITQVYIEIDYEYDDIPEGTNLHIKYDGSLVVVKAVYKKIGGSLVEQTDLQTIYDPNTKYIRRF